MAGGDPVGLRQGRVRIGHPGGGQLPPDLPVRQPLQAAQDERGAGGGAGRRQLPFQGEFTGPARMGEQTQAPGRRQDGRQPARPETQPAEAPRRQGPAQHLAAHVRVSGVGALGAAGAAGERDGGGSGAVGRLEGALGEGVGGQHAPAAAHRGRQQEVADPHQARVVLDERGLGLFHVDRGDGCR